MDHSRRGARLPPAEGSDAGLLATDHAGAAAPPPAAEAAAAAPTDRTPRSHGSQPQNEALAHTLAGDAGGVHPAVADTADGTSDPAAARSPTSSAALDGKVRPAQRIGRYQLLRQLGAGGMGVVFAAYDEELDRKVAVKLLREAGAARSDLRTRILREAQAMARLSHPNVVQIYEVGEVATAAGQVFIAMEFIEGTTLSEWQRQRSWEEVLPVYLQAGQGLCAAHESGLIHRDFKPDNVLVGKDGRPRVADFGLARIKSSEPSPPTAAELPGTASEPGGVLSAGNLLVSPLTQAGAILGTPAYMSPEQHSSEPTDNRCDQFSFCAALYEGLYKTLPFAGKTLSELRHNVLAGNVRPPPPQSTVPQKVYAALRRGLQTDPAQRFASMREMLSALAFDPRRDPGASPTSRRLFTRAILMIMLVLLAVMYPAVRRHSLTSTQMFVASGVFLAAATLAALYQRRALLHNEFHRNTLVYLLVFSVQQFCLYGFAALSRLTPLQMLPMELVCMAGTTALMAYFLFQSGWLLPPLMLAAGLWAELRPQDVSTVSIAAYLVSMGSVGYLWERAARARDCADKGRPLSVFPRP